jgi:hypothetical protein
VRVAYNIDRLVQALRDVTCAGVIELDKDMVDWVLQQLNGHVDLDNCQ